MVLGNIALLFLAYTIYKADNIEVNSGLRFQTLGTVIINTEKDETNYGFSLRRLRVPFEGWFITKDLKYKLEFAFEGKTPHTLDSYAEYKAVEFFALRFGQFKVPFNRERISSSGALELVDRSSLNSYFNLDRDIGVDAILSPSKIAKIHLSTFTGWGLNLDRVRVNKNLLYAARIELAPVGEKIKYDQPNLDGEKLINVGLSFALFPIDGEKEKDKFLAGRSLNTFMRNYIITKDDKGNQVVLSGTLLQGEFDIKIWWDIISFELEAIGGSFKDYSFSGFRVQPSLLFDKIGLAARYSNVSVGKDSFPILAEGSNHEITLGPSYYFKKHNAKLQLDYSAILKGSELKEHLIRLQFQLDVR